MSVEPDNNIQNANDSGISSDGKRSVVVDGAIDFGNDVDLYQFQANVGEDVILDLDANEFGSSLDGRLRLFDSFGNEIGNNDDSPAPGEASSLDAFLSFTPSSSANYYVGVSNVSNSDYDPNVVSDEASTQAVVGEYALEISLADENSGSDPDNTIAEAIALELEDPGDTVTLDDALASGEDVDLYRVRLEAGEGLTFDVDSNEQGFELDSRLRLFDADGNEIDGSDDDIAPGEESSLDPFLSFTADTAGDYYIGVSEFSNFAYDPVTGAQTNDAQGNTREYTLEASLFTEEPETPTPETLSPENPDTEDNTIAGAIATGLDNIGQSATFSNTIEPIADVDLYQVQLEAGEGLVLDVDAAGLLSPEESASSLDSLLRLFDADGNEIATDDDGSAPGEEFSLNSFLTFTAKSSGDYYVGVSSLVNSSYDPVRVESTDIGDGNTGDYDLNIEIIEVVTLDEDPDNTITEAMQRGLGTAAFEWEASHSKRALAFPHERLHQEAIATGIDSPGQSATFSDAIEPETDADLYQVQLDVGDNLLIDLDANEFGSSLDGRLRLFDAVGNELASIDDLPAPGEEAGLDSFIDFTAEVAGDYYVGVSDFNNSQYDPNNGITNLSPPTGNTTGNYDLTIEIAEDSAEPVFADFDRVTGTDNPDVLSGNSGSTFVDALGGDDVVTGASNDDYLVGGTGSDILSGNNGNDTLIGGLGFDVLSGGEGDDFLQGDEDINTLFGGAGADIFAISDNGNNTIADFELGTDKIQLVGSVSFADLTFEDIAGGSAVVISSSSNNSITTVPGIIASNLTQTLVF